MANAEILMSDGTNNISTKRNGVLHSFVATWAGGTIGTRASQQSYVPTVQPTSAQIVYVENSGQYIPIVFISGVTVYCNYYRASTSAVSGTNGRVDVMIYFD